MPELVISRNSIPPMSTVAVDKVRQLEALVLEYPQSPISTEHLFHAGMYARTIMIPAGVVLTGALIKLATVLIIFGDVLVYVGDESIELQGYNVFSAAANRKQAFVAKTDTYLTMIFPTDVKTVREVEEQFTDEYESLMSRKIDSSNHTIVTEN